MVPATAPILILLWSVVAGTGQTGGLSVARLGELGLSTLSLVIAVTISTTAIGFSTAWITTRTDIPGKRIWSTLVSLPLVIPSYVGALTLLAATGNQGSLSRLLRTFGFEGMGVLTGFGAAWIALTLWNFPFVHLLAVPALRRIDPALEESARALGASRMRTIRTVVIPQLRSTLTSAGLLVALYVMSDFGAVSLLRYETFTLAIYTQFRGRLDASPALFLSGILVLAGLIIVFVERWARGRAITRPHSAVARRQIPVALTRRRRLAATAFLGSIVLASLVLPLSTLMFWALRGLDLGNPLVTSVGAVAGETGRSLVTGVLAALVTAAAAIPVAVLSIRYPNRFAKGMESMAWAAYSLPHLAVGLGFLILALRFTPAIYQSLMLLIIAYVAMFMPQAIASTQAGLRLVGRDLEDASRGLGHGPGRTFAHITLPIVMPSVLAGAALVFLTVMKELPATLLLRPTGFETLAVRIWSASSELFYTQASVAALVLVGVSALPLYLLVIRDIHDV